MRNYLEALEHVYLKGEKRKDRTGTGTLSCFDVNLSFDLQEGFPAVTTKKLFTKSVWVEWEWMTSGSESAKLMLENDIHIWDEWMLPGDELGPVYGVQWRNWRNDSHLNDPETIDQLKRAIEMVINDQWSRRNLVTAWNPSDLPYMALPPCHVLFQFNVRRGEYLDLKWYQRSADLFLGLPFDIASYATTVHAVAKLAGLAPGKLSVALGDAHIYLNHLEQVELQLSRIPRRLPTLSIADRGQNSIDDFKWTDFKLEEYKSWPSIKAPISK